jgi:hypothetical protein
MASPTYSAGSSVLTAASLAAGKNAAALIDLSTVVQGLVWCQLETGTAPTVGTTFALRRAIGATSTGKTTLSSGASSAATSIVVASATNIQKGSVLAILTASGKVGEIVTVTTSYTSGTTIPISALINTYSTSDLVFLVEGTPSGGSIVPSSAGTWAANSSYDATLYPPIGVWVLSVANGDGTQTVGVTILTDTVPTIQ